MNTYTSKYQFNYSLHPQSSTLDPYLESPSTYANYGLDPLSHGYDTSVQETSSDHGTHAYVYTTQATVTDPQHNPYYDTTFTYPDPTANSAYYDQHIDYNSLPTASVPLDPSLDHAVSGYQYWPRDSPYDHSNDIINTTNGNGSSQDSVDIVHAIHNRGNSSQGSSRGSKNTSFSSASINTATSITTSPNSSRRPAPIQTQLESYPCVQDYVSRQDLFETPVTTQNHYQGTPLSTLPSSLLTMPPLPQSAIYTPITPIFPFVHSNNPMDARTQANNQSAFIQNSQYDYSSGMGSANVPTFGEIRGPDGETPVENLVSYDPWKQQSATRSTSINQKDLHKSHTCDTRTAIAKPKRRSSDRGTAGSNPSKTPEDRSTVRPERKQRSKRDRNDYKGNRRQQEDLGIETHNATITRPKRCRLPCMYASVGCEKVFTSRNEWKRHHLYSHFCTEYWICPHPRCVSHYPYTRGHAFARKDYLVQHLRHIHRHLGIEFNRRDTPDDILQAEIVEMGHRIRTKPPSLLRCPEPECNGRAFRGSKSIKDRLTHTLGHMEEEGSSAYRAGDNYNLSESDRDLIDWSLDHYVIEEAGHHDGYVCMNPLDYV